MTTIPELVEVSRIVRPLQAKEYLETGLCLLLGLALLLRGQFLPAQIVGVFLCVYAVSVPIGLVRWIRMGSAWRRDRHTRFAYVFDAEQIQMEGKESRLWTWADIVIFPKRVFAEEQVESFKELLEDKVTA
jgi:hypothetical protein